ncbi:MAG: hypothetical protein M1838_001443 [Thelocarpon superellum]|nr:MAG: hypothetical protein M1838_001443 [Thelocarpon superellum]
MRCPWVALTLLLVITPALSSPVAVDDATGPSPINGSVTALATHPALPNQVVDCRDPRTGVNASCWNDLNMTVWVQKWYAMHTCDSDEGFAACFLRINGMGSVNCTALNQQSCGSWLAEFVPNRDPEIFYVLTNIYGINNFFNSWYLATNFAATHAGTKIRKIVALLDPPKKKGVLLQDLITALLVGLAFIPGAVDIALCEGMEVLMHVAVASAMTALVVAPGVVKFLFPMATTDTSTVQIADLESQLSSLTQNIVARLAPGLRIGLNDIENFVLMASTGAFSGKPAFALDEQVDGLDLGLTTFLVSVCLGNNGWEGVVATDTDVSQIGKNGTRPQYELDCDQYDPYGVCNAWYYDSTGQNTYTLINYGSPKQNPYAKLEGMFSAGWTTGQMLFANAQACISSGNYGKGLLYSTDNATLHLECISQLRLCTWDKQCMRSGCEFSDCEPNKGFEMINTRWTQNFQVPAGYLGPMLTAKGAPHISHAGPN